MSELSPLRRWLRRAALALAALVVLAGLAVGALGLWLQHSPTLAGDLVARVEQVTGLQWRFADLTARLGWFGPELAFSQVRVLDQAGGELLSARAGRVGVDWFRMVRTFRAAARVTLDGPALSVEWTDAGLRVVGQPAAGGQGTHLDVDSLPTGLLRITNAKVSVHDRRSIVGTADRHMELDDVDINLVRDRDELSLGFGVHLPTRLGRRLDALLELAGPLHQPEQLGWQLQLRAGELQVAGWREWLPALSGERQLPRAGVMTLSLDASGRGRVAEGVQWQFESLGLVVPSPVPATPAAFVAANAPLSPESCGWGPPDARAVLNVPVMTAAYQASLAKLGIDRQPAWVQYGRIAMAGKLQRQGATTQLSLRDIDVVTGGLQWRGGRLQLAWTTDTAGLAEVHLESPELRPAPLVPLAGLLPQAALRERLANLSPRGAVAKVDLRLRRDNRWRPEGNAELRQFGIGPAGRSPGIVAVDGRFRGSASAGELLLHSPQFHLLMPQHLRLPETAELQAGRLGWRYDADGLRIQADDFAVRRADGYGEASARLWLPKDGSSPVLALHAAVHEVDMRSTTRFLSATHMPVATLAWLDAAFVSGQVTEGTIDYVGRMRCFPFRYGGGEFRVRVRTAGARLHYANGWADLENLVADVDLRSLGVDTRLYSGTVGGLAIDSGGGGIPDLRDGLLSVAGKTRGDLGRALRLVQSSPVAPTLGALFNGLNGQGMGQYDVRLNLPLRDLKRADIDVRTRLKGATVRFAGLDEAATQVQGELRVHNAALETAGITAQWLGGPVRFLATTAGPLGVVNELEATGRAQGEQVAGALRLPQAALSGAFDWRFRGRVPLDGKPDRLARATFRAETDFAGAAVNLPAPLNKPATEARPLRAELAISEAPAVSTAIGALPSAGTRLVTRLQWGADSAAMEWIHRSAWRFTRGTVRLGGGEAMLKDASRLWIEGHAPALDASGWIRLRLPESPTVSAHPMRIEELLRGADVTADHLLFMGYDFPHSSAQLSGGEAGWRVDVAGPAISGRVLVPFDLHAGRLQLDLDRLVANDARVGGAASEVDPRELPAMRLAVRSFEFEHRQLGQLTADLLRTPDGLRLARAEVKAPTFNALGSGSWSMVDRGTRREVESRVQLQVESTDVAKTLTALALAPAIAARHGTATIDVHWPGGPDAQFLARLGGRIGVQAEDGQVLGLEPGAGGRALGLMSLGALQRRLTLDFTDLTGKGLAFDRVAGDFELRDGDAFTKNLVLKGPAAEIGIVGRTGLRDRDYDQTVKVTGNLGGPIVAAGTLAGGPALGAALLVFSKVFKESLAGISRGYYRITGSWDAPTVQQIGASEAESRETVPPAEGVAK
jgi:uncharacterized protein (TIGR02099 family)